MALKQPAALMVTFEAVIEVPPRDEVTAGVNRLPGFFPAIIHRFILSLTLGAGKASHRTSPDTVCMKYESFARIRVIASELISRDKLIL